MKGLDRYLESAYEDQAKQDDWLADRVNDLMMNEYSPFTHKNIVEAIYDECLYRNDEELDHFQELIEKREVTQLGRFVFGRIVDYWERKAESQALEDWAKGNHD